MPSAPPPPPKEPLVPRWLIVSLCALVFLVLAGFGLYVVVLALVFSGPG